MNNIFEKCPSCGENAVIEPELGTEEYRVFRCINEHVFKKELKLKCEKDDEEVWEHLPEWTRVLKELSKG